jgi:hypothetical protein
MGSTETAFFFTFPARFFWGFTKWNKLYTRWQNTNLIGIITPFESFIPQQL